MKSELPVGVVLLIDAKWTKTPTLWDALNYKKRENVGFFIDIFASRINMPFKSLFEFSKKKLKHSPSVSGSVSEE